MKYSDQSYNLRIELDTENCDLSAEEIKQVEQDLNPLRKLTSTFPTSDLYIDITYHPRSSSFRVKTALVLPGRTLATGDDHAMMQPALQRSIRKLVNQLQTYKENLANRPETLKQRGGTRQEVAPTQEPDDASLRAAIDNADYAAFRQAMYVYEEGLRKRAGRWIERYPKAAAQLGEQLSLADIVEEVFLNAFEDFNSRPPQQRLGDWLAGLIDPSIKAMLKDPDAEKQNVEFARTFLEVRAS
jgi:ribosome-associated translation inhibitor RaiA